MNCIVLIQFSNLLFNLLVTVKLLNIILIKIMIKHVLQQGGQYIKQHFLSLKIFITCGPVAIWSVDTEHGIK